MLIGEMNPRWIPQKVFQSLKHIFIGTCCIDYLRTCLSACDKRRDLVGQRDLLRTEVLQRGLTCE